MRTLKHGMAAVVVIASLGIVVPGAFGGSAGADPKQGQGTTEPPQTWNCEIGGKTIQYTVVSQSDGLAYFHDVHSTTVFVVSYDVRHVAYVSLDSRYPDIPRYDHLRDLNNGQKLGQHAQVVPCDEYSDFFLTGGDGSASWRSPDEIAGVPYHVYQDRTWYVAMSGDGQGAIKGATSGKRHGKHTR